MKKETYCLAVLILLTLPGFSQSPVNWDNLRGLRWKPGSPARDVIVTKTPYFPASKGQNWAESNITNEIGANYITIDLTPAKKLVKDKEGTACRGQAPGSDCVITWKAAQYDEVADFIRQTSFNVLLHARVTPQGISTISGNGETDFANDMIAVISRLQNQGGIEKLKGVMIGEHETKSRKMLKTAIRISDKINQGTNNWLKNHGVVTLHGGGFGAEFRNIHWQVKDFEENTAGDQNFLVDMSTRAKGFAFTFKFFKGNLNFVPDTVTLDTTEWKTFLNTGEVTKNGNTYKYGFKLDHVERLFSDPVFNGGVSQDFKNILFVGDDADGIVNLWKPKTLNSYWALLDIFDSRDWNGFTFGVPFSLKEKTRMLSDSTGFEIPTLITLNYTKVDLWQEWERTIRIDSSGVPSNNRLGERLATDLVKSPYRLYPNPVSNGHIFIDIKPVETVHLSLFNSIGIKMEGKVILQGQQVKIDLSGLMPGYYFVRGAIGEMPFNERVMLK